MLIFSYLFFLTNVSGYKDLMLIAVKNKLKSQEKIIFFFTFFFTNIVTGFSTWKFERFFNFNLNEQVPR
jgi:hypothetical protein